MSESGDWLTPKVNGIYRFDKPPLIYWFMGFFYHYQKMKCGITLEHYQQDFHLHLASLSLMLMIGDTLYCWSKKGERKYLRP